MMEIKVLGPGCPRCEAVAQNTKAAVKDLDIEATMEKVSDIKDIQRYGILITPGLVIDGEVKSSGKIPEVGEIKAWLKKER